MKELLEERYCTLLHRYGFDAEVPVQDINTLIKDALYKFAHNCKTPAIWCYGKHTKMLMTDFIYELKDVNYIIDASYSACEDSGYQIIGEKDIKEKQIDGIIISSFRYKEEIKENLIQNYPGLRYLDIYELLEEKGIVLTLEYFSQTHPYGHYLNINEYKRKLKNASSQIEKTKLFEALIEEYIRIKDFRTAISCLREYMDTEELEQHEKHKEHKRLLEDLQSLYELEIKAASYISENNVLMLCIDGLRRKDVLDGRMPGFSQYISRKAYFYQNAYSVSTSTYESLVPAYSENADLRTRYYESASLPEDECRFIQEAKKQSRNVFFYTDSIKFVDSDMIHMTGKLQTATEKFWEFIQDALEEKNGLFYLHILYESHFSYPNPYTDGPIVAEGTHILFDYLSGNGGKPKTDYDTQHRDGLQYLDDVIMPFIEPLKCRMVMYADHGNIILNKDTLLENVEDTKFTFHEDLIQVPLIIKSPETGVGHTGDLCSIMDLNNILIGLMNGKAVVNRKKDFIKVVRSEIYNPDFKYLYQKYGHARGLLAFEVFIFCSGYKLAVYSDGASELYQAINDKKIDDEELKGRLLEQVKGLITVCA